MNLNNKEKLAQLRHEVDNIDDLIQNLLETRYKLCQKIRFYKLFNQMKLFDPEREQEILNRVASQSKILTEEQITEIFKTIISIGRKIVCNGDKQ